MLEILLLSLLLLTANGFGLGNAQVTFSAGFSDDMVLQRGPGSAAIYGLVAGRPSSTLASDMIEVTVTDDNSGASYAVKALIIRPSPGSGAAKAAAGGTTNPLCGSRCVGAGHCCTGQIAACQMPSCAMGCILAGRTPDVAACKASCAAANNKCEYTVVSPAGPHHLPGDTTQNQTFEMCSNGPILANGTQCRSCSGCEFGAATAATEPGVWKAGGSHTISAAASSAGGSPAVLRRVTFGDVFICSGQSNMDL
eukprot:gene20067-24569_t